MAKKSVRNRAAKRLATVTKFATKRADLKSRMMNAKLSVEEREESAKKFHALPRDAAPVRVRRRCSLTGRPHGVYRKFGLGRNKLREAAMRGDIPGLVKASW